MNRALVLEYLELHAQAHTCATRLAELREVLLPLLREGAESPADLPYSLVRRIQTRQTKDYKAPLYRLLRRILGKVRADKRLAQIEAKFGSTEVEQLCVEQNKAFAAAITENVA